MRIPPIASRWLISILLTGGFVLSGCTLIPPFQRPVSPVPSQYPGTTASGEGHAAEIAWETLFGDDRLKRLIEIALTNNLDLRVATLNVELSRAQHRISKSARWPAAMGTASYVRSGDFESASDLWKVSAGTTAYELDLFGRVRSLNRRALEQYLATEEAQRSVHISLVAEVADQYFRLRQAEEQLALAQQTLRTVEESYRLNQARFEAGAAGELDLRTAEGQVQIARINEIASARRIEEARNALALLLGRELPVDLPAPMSFLAATLVADVPPGLPSELVRRRPDILQAEHALRAANANIGAARAALFPSIFLTAEVGTTSTQLANLFGAGTGLWSFAPQVSVPIFTGGRNRADLKAAHVSTRIEVARYQKAIEIAFREVADALAGIHSYAEESRAQEALIETQQKRFELATARYREGEDSYLNVLTAQQDLFDAQQSHLQTRLLRIASQIALYKSLGGGWR